MDKSSVYIKLNDKKEIVSIEGGYTTPAALTDWIEIDSGTGDKYNLAQSHYLNESLTTDEGVYKFIYKSGKIERKAAEAIAAEAAALPKEKTINDKMAELEELTAILLQNESDLLEDLCLLKIN